MTDAVPGSADRYRYFGDPIHDIGQHLRLFESANGGKRIFLSEERAAILRVCERLRPLDEHAQMARLRLRDRFRDLPMDEILGHLRALRDDGLLESTADLEARVRPPIGEHRTVSIETVGVLTANRPTGLRRVVTTTAENAARHGRRVQFVVADDSNDEGRQANLAALAEIKRRFGVGVAYAGPTEKASYARRLAEHCDVPLDVVMSAFRRPAGWPPAPGANRNVLLLHTVGEAFLSLDDDMVCRIGRLPEEAPGLALSGESDPTHWWFYANPETTIAQTQFVDADLLALHESLLGMNVGRLASEQLGTGQLDLDGLTDGFLENMDVDGGAVTFTMAGVLGDSGLRESLPFFYVEGPTLERLFRAEGGHRAAMASRQMARGVLRTTISDTDFCIGMNIGLDNRGLLPPFQTAARNEDGIFAQMVRSTIPGSFIGFLPRTLLHDPVIRRHYEIERFHESVGALEAADALLDVMKSWPHPPVRSTPRRRLMALGAFLVELGTAPAAEFEQELRSAWLGRCSWEAAYIEKALKDHGDRQPASWSADLQTYLEALQARLDSDPSPAPGELAGRPPEEGRAVMQRFLEDFGRLLQAWPDLVEGARELRLGGCRPALPL